MHWKNAKPWLFAVGVAVAYYVVVFGIWSFLPQHNPITNWLFDRFVKTDPGLYRGLVWTHDIIANVLLALPFAYLLTMIRPDKRWAYVALAVMVVFAWEYRLVLFSIGILPFVRTSHHAWLGMILMLVYLPTAVLLMSLFKRTRERF